MSRAFPPADARRPRLYLVRHGESDWNAAGRLCTRTDRPLTETGRTQASELGLRLATVPFAAAISSPLVRATETSALILAGAGRADVLPVRTDERLREVDFGPFEGWTEMDLAADPRGRAWRAGRLREIEGMESDADAAARAEAVFADFAASSQGPTLVVSHGYFIRMLVATCVLGLGPEAVRILRVRNCRPTVVELTTPPLLLGLNLEGPEPFDIAG